MFTARVDTKVSTWRSAKDRMDLKIRTVRVVASAMEDQNRKMFYAKTAQVGYYPTCANHAAMVVDPAVRLDTVTMTLTAYR